MPNYSAATAPETLDSETVTVIDEAIVKAADGRVFREVARCVGALKGL